MTEVDNYSLILELAVGIPMAFLLFVLTILLCIVYKSHRQRQTKSKFIEEDLDRPVPIEGSLFAGNMAKRYNGSKSFLPFGGYWDNGSFDYHEDIDRTSYLGKMSN
ncbi:uncharacterized protein LOC134695526 [Mytilus trossulus]|uniref:uncharacterized protein LOC134695526 n=1 Tax=Mytilus trossulus TaxID=6551 RepID=UPI0030047385